MVAPRLRTTFNSTKSYVIMVGIFDSVRLLTTRFISLQFYSIPPQPNTLGSSTVKNCLQLNQALRGDDWDYSNAFVARLNAPLNFSVRLLTKRLPIPRLRIGHQSNTIAYEHQTTHS